MAQRNSDYERKASDFYPTPEWCTHLLCDKLIDLGYNPKMIWEPAAGDLVMARVLEERFPEADVRATDIRAMPSRVNVNDKLTKYMTSSVDFLDLGYDFPAQDAIITNPPYHRKLIVPFIERALSLTKPKRGIVAMLLRVDFDSAATRKHLFGDHPAWAHKIVMNKRVVWFIREDGKKEAPSENHAWYIWDWKHTGPANIIYGPH